MEKGKWDTFVSKETEPRLCSIVGGHKCHVLRRDHNRLSRMILESEGLGSPESFVMYVSSWHVGWVNTKFICV